MKKSLLALAVLGAFAGAASAQSSVTIFGVVDAAARSVHNAGQKSVKELASGGWNTSRLGFRGVEDLGGGLKAGFWLEHGINIDDGTQASSTFWNRRSTVSLMGNFGEVRLGRDYSPTFWQFVGFDVFNYGGIGGISNVVYAPVAYANAGNAGSTNGTATNSALNSGAWGTRNVNNAVSYFLPSGIGGVYGQLTVAAPEGVVSNKYTGGRVGYAGGPLDVAVLYSQTNSPLNSEKLKVWGLGGSYNFGVAKVLGQYIEQKWNPAKQKIWEVATVVPLGLGEIHASYLHSDLSNVGGNAGNAKQFALGYAYNLSKRTALYANAARLDNGGTGQLSVSAAPSSTQAAGTNQLPTAGGNSTGYEVGIRHSF
jgi:predicted porin